jgi:predicted transposase/invertase (TIGR01784 family)
METTEQTNPFIPFTSDYGFKVTFGNEENTVFLRKALQALIDSPVPIVKVVFDKTAFEGITRDGRSGLYDMACTDENDNSFIVEMQLSDYEHIVQRLKFYGFQKFNTLVRKGDFKYAGLPKVYCIGILAKHDSGLKGHHHLGAIRTRDGGLMDAQMEIITVELDKFTLDAQACTTDLEKLLFTMKSLSNTLQKPIEYPKFWTEEWLKIALHELDTRAMSPEKRMAYEMTLANNAEAIRQENEKLDAARAEGEARGEAKARAESEAKARQEKIETIRRMSSSGLDDQSISIFLNESLEFVQKAREGLS